MTEPTPSAPAEPDTTPGTLHGAVADPDESPVPPDLGSPGMGYGADQVPEPQLRTFGEMLIAVRAFHSNSWR